MKQSAQRAWTLADLRRHRNAILEVARRYGAFNVRVFGSVARGDATATSDIDFLVNYREGVSLLDVVALWQDLEDFLNCSVDVVDERAIKERLRPRILKDATPL